jgi:hypothetical protein
LQPAWSDDETAIRLCRHEKPKPGYLSMIRKSGYRFSEKIMLKQKIERDDDSKKSHPALRCQRTSKRRDVVAVTPRDMN